MNTLDAFERDILYQLDFLRSFDPPDAVSERMQKRSVFCGSGDSLSAAMLAESFSGYLVRSSDPLDAIQDGRIVKDRRLYLVSVSGNTVSNIRAARTAVSVAITAAPDSRLAKACSRTVPLSYPSSGVFTAGSVSFLASALTCISLVTRIRMPDAGRIFASAKEAACRCRISGNVFVLGDRLTFPVAAYCSAKFYEVLGRVSQYERVEQFSHMGLFSARPGDTVLIFAEPAGYGRRLAANLKGLGLNVILPMPGRDRIRRLLYLIFFSQFLVLAQARSEGLRECHFVSAGRVRDASSAMIY